MSSASLIGRYEILQELGQGAMGVVYKGRDPMMDRTVAIKRILSVALSGPMADEYRERFYREARAAGRLQHPGIVAVYDVGEHEGTPYLVMEYVSGRTLASLLDSGQSFTMERIYDLGKQIAEALYYAHKNGVVHRDIKPANILLTDPAAHGVERTKITDFGVAKLTSAQITTTGQLLGTPSFMPPEQFTGAPLDGRADIFSLGVILYWMATGDKPFLGDTITSISYKIVHTDSIPPRKLNPAISAAFESVILKCLEKDPAARYPTGEALAADLASLRAGQKPGPAVAPGVGQSALGAGPGFDPQATSMTGIGLPASGVHPPRPSAASAAVPAVAKKPRTLLYALLAVLLVVSVIGGWALFRSEIAPPSTTDLPQQGTANPPPAVPPPPAGTHPRQDTAAVELEKARVAREEALVQAQKAQLEGKQQGFPTPSVPPVPGSDFGRQIESQPAEALRGPPIADENPNLNPRKAEPGRPLNPDEAAEIRIDASRLPEWVGLLVRMDGEILVQRQPRTDPGDAPDLDDILIPPGEHEFRVVSGVSGARLGVSNSVRGEFAVGKKRTLRIDLLDHSGRPLRRSARPGAAASLFITIR